MFLRPNFNYFNKPIQRLISSLQANTSQCSVVLVLSKVLPGQTGAATAQYWAVSDSSFNLMGETVNTQTTTVFSGKGNLVFRIIILILPNKICYRFFSTGRKVRVLIIICLLVVLSICLREKYEENMSKGKNVTHSIY